jgi:RHS repeat-associated protein
VKDPLALVPPPIVHRRPGRARRIVAAATAAAVISSLLQAPAWADRPKPFTPPTAKKMSAVAVSKVDPVVPKQATMPDGTRKPAAVWPAAGTAEVAVSGSVRAAGLPVRVAPPRTIGAAVQKAAQAPSRVGVRVLDRAATERARVRGLLLQVNRTDGKAAAGAVDVTVDYSGFRTAYGGDWASRLRLVALPSCALTTPERAECVGRPLPSRNDPRASTVSATVGLAAAADTLVAATAGTSGAAGSFAATSLQPSSTWSAGGSSGDFSWSYPMRVPPAPGAAVPTVELSYSAQSVDGRHAASNNQPSWVGEGFDASVGGFIERRYEACADDMGSGANNTKKTGDLCWATNNATLSLAGHSGELIYNSGEQRWHLRGDDGSRIERKTGASNGDNDGEYWVVTTTDGTQYWFGAHRLPGWSSGASVTNSTWTAPVYGNNDGEPCHATAFADSSCTQAWRWNVDYVVDVNGNSASYWYDTDTNEYGRNLTSSSVAGYVRDGHLNHVEYGTRRDNGADSRFTASAPARVDFGVTDRCLSGCGTHDAAHWPDTPWDQQCTGSTCQTFSPSFWSTKRLSTVTTKVWNGSSYDSVDQWSLTQTFPDPGDGTRAGLWLSKLSHAGLVGGSANVPDVEFSGVQLSNRVDTIDFAAAMNWWRISQIRYESGGTVSVLYSDPECVAKTNVPTAPASNTKRCYPVRWTPEGYTDPVTDYFHKYVVTTVYEADNTGGVTPKGSPRVVFNYSYLGAPAWHYTDDDGLIEPKDKTWSQWRGYAQVGVTVGDSGEQTYTETKYFRGMHGDKADSGTRTVTVTGTGVPTVNDEDAYAGLTRESTVYNGPGGAVVSRKVSEPWQSAATASRTINGDTVVARFIRTAATHDRTVLDGGRAERVRSVHSTFDAYGMTVAVDDAGDAGVTGDETCTKTTYEPRNTTAWTLSGPHRSLVLAVPCGSADDLTKLTDDDVVSDTRTYFDNATAWGTAPTRGLVTRTEQANAWNGGNPTYEQTGRTAYDASGRVTSTWDALDHQSTTAYTPANGGLVTQTLLTNALGHTTTTTIAPAWGLPTKVVDANGKKTEAAYDALGRLVGVWNPGRVKGTDTANTTYSYLISNTAATAVGTSKLNAAGNYLTTYTLYDGLLRERQTQAPSPSGGRLLTELFYDTVGRQSREHGSYYATGAPSATLATATDRQDVPNQTRLVYDGAGRITASIFQPYTTERWRTTTAYGGDRIDVTPPSGGTLTSTVNDALGRTTALRQYHGTTPTGASDTTTYTYGHKNELKKVTDAAGNHWDYTYDLRGRQLTASDPDKGTVTSTYDAASRVTSTLDARGVKLQYTYDNLDRRTAILQTGVGTRARWFYDTLAKGQLDKSVRFVGTANYTRQIGAYDDAYRPTQQTYTIPATEAGIGGSYTVENYYNVDGSLNTTGYPAAGDLPLESVAYHYDSTTGLPTTSTSSFTGRSISYAAGTTYDALGRISQLTLYPGLFDDLGKRVYQSFGYELETGRLVNTRTDREAVAPYTVTNTTYAYDKAGNITGTSDAATGDNQCFQYDYLRRLTEAWTPAVDDGCKTAASTAGLGGPAPYWQSWTYDLTGNRLSQVDHATTNGGANTTTNYTYPAAGSTRPHALTGTTTTTGSSSVTAGYTYDNAGNTLTRPAGAGNGTLTWDPEDHLASSTDSTGTTSYIYDADGNRLVSHDPAGTTLFLPGQELRYTIATGATTCTRYYSFGGATIASRTATGVSWLSSDHQGTASVAIERDTQNMSIRRQKPFGASRGNAVAWPNPHGFVGGTSDNTGLTHLGAREYDPGIGRFISVDPVQNLADPQQWNAYAYAGNNPVTDSDPSGLCVTDACISHQLNLDDRDKPTHPGGGPDKTGCGMDCVARKPAPHDDVPMRAMVTLGYNGSPDYTYMDALKWASQNEAGYKFVCIHTFGRSEDSCNQSDPWKKPHPAGKNDWMILVAPLVALAAVGAAEACLAALPVCLYEAGDGAVGFYGYGSLAGTAGGLSSLAAMRESGDLSSDAMELMLGRCSFSPDTRVLLANGRTKAIKDIGIGDVVVATDPGEDRTAAKAVTRLHDNLDTDLADLTIVGRHGGRSILHTTQNHPFWDATTAAWTPAGVLRPGDRLSTPDGTATVVHVRSFRGARHMLNLTIADVHTYYVLAGNTPVLVHNLGGPSGPAAGAAGTQMLIDDLQARGYVIRGTEISMTAANGVNVRFDVVAEKGGVLSVYDAKNGPKAGFTKNQGARGGYASIETSGGTFYGPNAKNAGLAGRTLGPTRVNIAGFGGYPHC